MCQTAARAPSALAVGSGPAVGPRRGPTCGPDARPTSSERPGGAFSIVSPTRLPLPAPPQRTFLSPLLFDVHFPWPLSPLLFFFLLCFGMYFHLSRCCESFVGEHLPGRVRNISLLFVFLVRNTRPAGRSFSGTGGAASRAVVVDLPLAGTLPPDVFIIMFEKIFSKKNKISGPLPVGMEFVIGEALCE